MSNGYGYNQVRPANTGQYQGFGNGGYNSYPYPTGGQQPAGMQAALPAGMPAQPSQMQQMQHMQQLQQLQQLQQTQQMPPAVPSGAFVTPAGGNVVTVPGVEESYVENILRLNRGKLATFYMTYENNTQWNAKVFKGIIEAAGRDHIIISDPTTGMRFMLLTLNLDYVTFDEPIAYEYPFQGGVVSSSTPLGMATIGTAR